MDEEYKYYAFISYSSKDTRWGFRIQKKLENYRMPSTLCSEKGWKRKPIRPVFFAPTDIQPSDLSEELKMRLRKSRHLVVICSPNSAQSDWVGKEIEYFHSLGRPENIHLFIVDGIPNSGDVETECFNPALHRIGLPELLGANIHEKVSRFPFLNKERAYVQLITKLLGVEFDSIWQRHKRQLADKVVLIVCTIAFVMVSLFHVWKSNQPFDACIRLQEVSTVNDSLPPLRDAVISVMLEDDMRQYILAAIDDEICVLHLPHSFLGKRVPVHLTCEGYELVDSICTLNLFNQLNIIRNESYYGEIRVTLYSLKLSRPLPDTEVSIDGMKCKSNEYGIICCTIPLDRQKRFYKVTSESLCFECDTLYAHCGPDDYLFVE